MTSSALCGIATKSLRRARSRMLPVTGPVILLFALTGCPAPGGKCSDNGSVCVTNDAGHVDNQVDGGVGSDGGAAGAEVSCDAGQFQCDGGCVDFAAAFRPVTFDGGANTYKLLAVDLLSGAAADADELVGHGGGMLRTWAVSSNGLESASEQPFNSVARIAAGDVDADGRLELVATTGSSELYVLRFADDAGFTGQSYPSAGLTQGVVVEDFTTDGLGDIVVSNVFADRITLYMNEGDGGFSAGIETAAGFNPTRVSAGQFGQGLRGIAVLSSGIDRTSIALPKGDGGFAVTNYTFNAQPSHLFVTDATADGRDDVVVYVPASGGSIRLRAGRADGGLDAVATTAFGSNLIDVVVGDLNGDAFPDVFGVSGLDPSGYVLLGARDGGFGPLIPVALGSASNAVTLGEFDGDGRIDIAIARSDSAITVLHGVCQ